MDYLNQFNNEFHREIISICHSLNLKEHNFSRGCKLYTNYQRICIMFLFIRSKKSLRDFCAEFEETKWKSWLQLKKCPSHSTLHHWFKYFSLDFLRKLIEKTLINQTPKVLAIDGTGIDSQFKSSYFEKRLKDFKSFRKPSNPYHKLDILIDIENNQIFDYSFTLKNRHDSYVAKKLFKRFKYKNCLILADKGYYDLVLFQILKSKLTILVVPPKNYGSKRRTKQRLSRRDFHDSFYENEQLYPLRNKVESSFSAFKRVCKRNLRSKNHIMKKKEMALNIFWYNLRIKIALTIFILLKLLNLERIYIFKIRFFN